MSKLRGTYAISGLGSASLDVMVYEAKSKSWAKAPPGVLADIRRRAAGENRNYQFWENAFDILGKYGNWHGSTRGGGRDDNKPGGIGDVNVKPRNVADAVTKTHDIDSWLQANFEIGSVVFIRQNANWVKYVVKSWEKVQADVVVGLGGVMSVVTATVLLEAMKKTRPMLYTPI